MVWGLFKKAVVADRLAVMVDTVYNNPQTHEGFTVILATIFFAFQIYCDFSGYSDMAIGAAQVMGFKLMTNFNRPYFAKSISEFWKRWHISLSTWFKDYLYIPLGGNRVERKRMFFNLFLTFMISGLWHGANWTFIIWGALHGFYLIAALVFTPLTVKFNKITGIKNYPVLYKWSQSLAVFALVCFAWVFFRASSIQDAYTIITNATAVHMSQFSLNMLGENPFELFAGMFFICLLIIIEWNMRGKQMRVFMSTRPWYYRWALYIMLVLVILNFGVFGGNSFIYFQF
jgi:D-alanyl-lipoteichoic acid acyltransferase DltB (MBOAT superfamily)